MSDLPDAVKAQLQRFQLALHKLEDLRDDLVERSGTVAQVSVKALERHSLLQLSTVERAQYQLSAAEVVHHAFRQYLRAQGQASSEHPIHAETERLKTYRKKVRKLETEEYLSTHKPSLEVNVAAANRFISHAIPDLSKEQRAALQQAGAKRKLTQPEEKVNQNAAQMARTFLAQTFGKSQRSKGQDKKAKVHETK